MSNAISKMPARKALVKINVYLSVPLNTSDTHCFTLANQESVVVVVVFDESMMTDVRLVAVSTIALLKSSVFRLAFVVWSAETSYFEKDLVNFLLT